MSLADRWICHRLQVTEERLEKALEEYRFNEYANALYDFFWRDLCDWYLEAIKPVARQNDVSGQTARGVLAACFDTVVRYLHPVMPFITERLWIALNAFAADRSMPGVVLPASELCINAPWPQVDLKNLTGENVEADFDFARELVVAVRNVRNKYNVPPKKKVDVSIQASASQDTLLRDCQSLIETLAVCNVTAIGPQVQAGENSATTVVGEIEIYIDDLVDQEAEKDILTKRKDDLSKSLKALEGRLNNPGYVDKAPAHLVEQSRQKLEDTRKEIETIEQKLASL